MINKTCLTKRGQDSGTIWAQQQQQNDEESQKHFLPGIRNWYLLFYLFQISCKSTPQISPVIKEFPCALVAEKLHLREVQFVHYPKPQGPPISDTLHHLTLHTHIKTNHELIKN